MASSMKSGLMALIPFAVLALISSGPASPQLPAVSTEPGLDGDPIPYEFGYDFSDGTGMVQHRQESSDGKGVVQGSYGYTDSVGVYRNVVYKADADGYRATIRSNEPGLSNSSSSADATFIIEPPPPGAVAQQNVSKSEGKPVVIKP